MSFFFFKKPKGYVGINSRKHWQKRLSARRLILCVLKGKLWLTRTPLSGAFRLGSDDIYLILYIYKYRSFRLQVYINLLISFDHGTSCDSDQ
jgi:hypothetical protein